MKFQKVFKLGSSLISHPSVVSAALASVRQYLARLKELRQIAGKKLRQKSFSGVIIRNQGMIQRILCETDR